jgi:hypothetical protein
MFGLDAPSKVEAVLKVELIADRAGQHPQCAGLAHRERQIRRRQASYPRLLQRVTTPR